MAMDMEKDLLEQHGFTLLEMLVVILLISLGLLAIYQVHLSSTKTAAFNKNLILATQFAKSKIEDLKAESFSGIKDGSDNSSSAADIVDTRVFFLRTWGATPLSGYPDTLQIRVDVGWTLGARCADISQCEHSVRLTSFVSDF